MKLPGRVRNNGENINRCNQFAQRRRRENSPSHARAIFCRACAHDISQRLKAASGSRASCADSNASDIPLPVTGGIIVSASPMHTSDFSEARCGCNDRPATEQKDFSSNSARANRSCKIVPGFPRSRSNPFFGKSFSPLRRNRPQTFTSPPDSLQMPT